VPVCSQLHAPGVRGSAAEDIFRFRWQPGALSDAATAHLKHRHTCSDRDDMLKFKTIRVPVVTSEQLLTPKY